MKRIAVFGGAFNPIHNGHLHLARCFDARLRFDKILLIPSHISPHKDSSALAAGEDRLAMCALAAAEQDERYEASDLELRRDGKSYTIDTIRALRAFYPGDGLYLIVGSDMFLSLDSWRESSELCRMVTVCAAAREDGEYEALLRRQRALDARGARCVVLETDALPVSSTMIRQRIRTGMDAGEFLPAGVAQYIRGHGLYRDA